MALIPVQQARQLFTDAFIGTWRESFPVNNFWRSFTTDKTVSTKFVSLEVQRGTKKIAADVMRGAESNRNKFGLSTAKTYLPPYFFESFTNEDLAIYDQLFGKYGEVTDTEIVKEVIKDVTSNYVELKNKIERAYEKQAADMFQTGTISMVNGDAIDFKMKSSHKQTLSTKWDNTTPEIFKSLKTALDQLKTDGAAAVEFDVVMGDLAGQALLDSAEYQKKFGTFPITATQYNLPRYEATTGAVFHNRISVGQYIVNLWTTGDTYTNESGVDTPFLDPKKVVIIAKSMQAIMTFAAIPRVLTDNGVNQNSQFSQVLENGKYFLNNFVKNEVSSHIFTIASAGVPVPLTVDHYSCLTVLA